MRVGQQIIRAGCLLFAHGAHAVVLLAPTLVLSGSESVGLATGCFAISIIAAAALESLFVSKQFQVPNAAVQDKLAIRVAQMVGLGLLGVFWLAQIERLALGHNSLAWQTSGATLVAVGIVLRVAAIRALGPQFVSDICVGERIVRDGVYAWLRHPSEIGLLLIATGGPLLLGAPLTASVALVALLPISLWRMRREDVALAG